MSLKNNFDKSVWNKAVKIAVDTLLKKKITEVSKMDYDTDLLIREKCLKQIPLKVEWLDLDPFTGKFIGNDWFDCDIIDCTGHKKNIWLAKNWFWAEENPYGMISNDYSSEFWDEVDYYLRNSKSMQKIKGKNIHKFVNPEKMF